MNDPRVTRYMDVVAHSSAVRCIHLGPRSGRVFASGGDDRRVNLWAIGKAEPVMSLTGHTSPVMSVSLDLTEQILVSGGLNGAIKMWDLEHTKVIRSLLGHKAAAQCVQFHPFGEFFASGSADAALKVWDVRRKGCVQSYATGHEAGVNAICMSPDGKWVVTGGSDDTVKLWDLTAGRQLTSLAHSARPIRALSFHPNEFLLATAGGDAVRFWDMETFEQVSSAQGAGDVRAMRFMADGSALLVADIGGLKIYSWEPALLCDDARIPWPGISDINVAQGTTSMVAGSVDQCLVTVWAAEMQSMRPFAASSHRPTPAAREPEAANAYDPMVSSTAATQQQDVRAALESRPHHHRFETRPPFDPQRMPANAGLEETRGSRDFGSQLSLQWAGEHAAEGYIVQQSQGAFDNETGRSTESLAGAFGEPPPRAGRPSEMVKVGASMPGNPADDSLARAASEKLAIERHDEAISERESRISRSTEARASPTPRRVLRNITPGGSPAAGRYRSQPDIAGSEDEHDDSRKRRGSPIRAITAAGAAGGKGSAPFVPVAGERPLGLDISAFAQRPKAELQTRTNPTSSWTAGGGAAPLSAGTQEELLEALSSGHYTMVGVLNQKLDTIRSVRAVWEESDPRLALERLRAANDSCVSADVLKVINSGGGRRGLNLDVVGVLCCIIREMLFEVFEDHITTACETLRLLLKAFGSVIASNLAPQPYAGVDISKEERIRKCRDASRDLAETRDLLLELRGAPGRLGTLVCDVLTEYQVLGM